MVYEVLKEIRLPFRHRWLLDKYEVDFLIGNIVLEVNGHEQDVQRNNKLVELGYIPLHLHNDEVFANKENLKEKIICLLQN